MNPTSQTLFAQNSAQGPLQEVPPAHPGDREAGRLVGLSGFPLSHGPSHFRDGWFHRVSRHLEPVKKKKKNMWYLVRASGKFHSAGGQWQVVCSGISGPVPGQGSLEARVTGSQHHIYSRKLPAPRTASLCTTSSEGASLCVAWLPGPALPLRELEAQMVTSFLRLRFHVCEAGLCRTRSGPADGACKYWLMPGWRAPSVLGLWITISAFDLVVPLTSRQNPEGDLCCKVPHVWGRFQQSDFTVPSTRM